MAYTKQTWTNDDPDTPLSGPRMSHVEDGIGDAHQAIEDLEFSDIGGTASSGQIPSLAIAKITGLQAALDAKADDDHDHAGVYATPAQVNAKADADHGHDLGDVSGLQAALDAITGRLDALEGGAE